MPFEISVSPTVSLGPARRGLRSRSRSESVAFAYWSSVTARRHHIRGGAGPAPDLASLRMHLMADAKAPTLREAARIEEAVTRAHLQEVPVFGPPDLDPAEPIEDDAVAAELRSQALFGGGRKPLARRRAARQVAGDAAEEISERRRQVERDRHADLGEAERNFASLVGNEPDAVLGAVEAAFELDDVPAAPVDASGATVSLVIRAPDRDAVPGRRVAWAKRGKPALTERSEMECRALGVRVMASSILAAVRRALASAPGIDTVRVVAVQGDRWRRDVNAVYAGRFDRSAAAGWATEDVDAVAVLAGAGLLVATEDLRPLELASEADIDRMVKEISAALYP